MERKYMFFDIDGMLAGNATKKIIPSTQKTLDRLQEAGYFVVIVIGRAHYRVRGFMEASDLHNMVYCGGNGLTINDELIVNTPLDRQKAIAVYKEAHALGYGTLMMLDDSIGVYDMDDRFLRQHGERREPINYMSYVDFDIDQVKDVCKLYISVPREEEHRLTKKDTLGNLRSVEAYLMSQHGRRKEGILDIMERLSGPVKDVVIFGGNYNDLAMFDDAWFSIAMGNTYDALKKKADYVTERDASDGIYKAHLKFGWIS